MTRAFCSISHGDIAAAVDYNWLSLIYYPAFVIVALLGPVSLISSLRIVPDKGECHVA
jgi:hypothetical protein